MCLKNFMFLLKTCNEFHIDNGGEYCGPSNAYFQEHGIKHEKAPLKTP